MKRIVMALIAAVALCGCHRGPAAARPNIALIVIDTLRADHLAAYGYPRETTPFLSCLARTGVVFDRAHAPSSWTVPATASLLTSVYPNQHGMTLGDRYYRGEHVEPLPARLNRIPAGLETMAEALKKRGYRTYGVSDNYFVSPQGGFDRGFDRFINFNYMTADEVNRALMRWKDEITRGDTPYFLYVHYVDPHWPYHVRRPWFEEDGDRSFDERAYDSEIGFVDDRIRQFAEAYKLLENAVVIVVSDHGEEFGDHGGQGHRFKLYEELLHVPLIVHFPGAGGTPARIKADVSLVDVLPTVRRLVGGSPGSQDMGIDLATLMRGGAAPSRALFAMRTKEADVVLGEKKSVLFDGRKLIVNLPDGADEFYDLNTDPGERTSLAAASAPAIDTLKAKLAEFEKAAKVYPREFVDLGKLSPDLKEQLKSLGYLH